MNVSVPHYEHTVVRGRLSVKTELVSWQTVPYIMIVAESSSRNVALKKEERLLRRTQGLKAVVLTQWS